MNVIYFYYRTPSNIKVYSDLINAIGEACDFDRIGKNDPPRTKYTCSNQVCEMLDEQLQLNKWVFIHASDGLFITVQHRDDKRWCHSTLSLSSVSDYPFIINTIDTMLDVYLCISGLSGGGKDQKWNVHLRSSDCPPEILDRGRNFLTR